MLHKWYEFSDSGRRWKVDCTEQGHYEDDAVLVYWVFNNVVEGDASIEGVQAHLWRRYYPGNFDLGGGTRHWFQKDWPSV